MGSETYFFILYAEFFPDIIAMKFNRSLGDIHDVSDFFGNSAFKDQASYPYLGLSKIQILRLYFL